MILWIIFLFIPSKLSHKEVIRDNMRYVRIDKYKVFGVCKFWIDTKYVYNGTSMARLSDTYA